MTPLFRFLRRLLKWLLGLLLLMLLASLGLTWLLRDLTPPASSLMLQRWAEARLGSRDDYTLRYHWRDWDQISPHMRLAVVAAEDQKFPRHRGFDLDSIQDALETYRDGGRLRGASTISQQVAKNLFLWPGRNMIRKGLEAWFTVLIEQLWPKRRILEVYLNIAEFGDGIFGVEAASQEYFERSAAMLSPEQAALLAAVLPNPHRLRADAPSAHLRQRQAWIQRQMRQLGGPGYLADL